MTRHSSRLSVSQISLKVTANGATNILLANVDINAVTGSNLVDIQFTSPQPALGSDRKCLGRSLH